MMCMMCCLYAVLVNAHCVLSMWDAELLLLCCLSTAWMCRATTTPATPLDSSGSMRSGQWEQSVWAWASVSDPGASSMLCCVSGSGNTTVCRGPLRRSISRIRVIRLQSFPEYMSTSGASWVCESHVFKADTQCSTEALKGHHDDV